MRDPHHSARTGRGRMGALVVACGLVAAACGSAGSAGVRVQSVPVDLVFGITEPPEDTLPFAPPPSDTPPPPPAQPTVVTLPPFRNPAATNLPPLEPTDTVPECPPAPLGATGVKALEPEITGEVAEGTYRWQRNGQRVYTDGTTLPIAGFETRLIRDVTPAGDEFDPDAYTFEVVAPNPFDDEVISYNVYRVKPHTEAQVAVGGAPTVDEPRVNEPEGGVSIIESGFLDDTGNKIATFRPTNGLLLLPLPVDIGEEFTSTAVDPRTGAAITAQSKVVGPARVDACGELIDGWRVESTQNRSDTLSEVTFNVLIATQLGGIPIQEELNIPLSDGSVVDLIFSIGQITPDPLPEGAS